MSDAVVTPSTVGDRLDIIDICTRMGWLADRRDWSSLVELPRQRLVDAWAVGLGRFAATHHLVSNALVTLDGDSASCFAAFQATHVLPNPYGGPTWTPGGRYLYTLSRGSHGWLITGLAMTAVWATGHPRIVSLTADGEQ